MAQRSIAATLFVLLALSSGAVTRHNDDSCDIALLPAATLLLPYFEVDEPSWVWNLPPSANTIFTITNVSNEDAIARVTLWTDFAFPVISFDVYLTGYDVQSISLYDVIERGLIAPDAGTGTDITNRGDFSIVNPRVDLDECNRLPGGLDDAYVVRMQSAFNDGTVPDLGDLAGCNNVGGEHDGWVGYATIDIVGRCSSVIPTDAEYWATDIRYDNVLVGDYVQFNEREDLTQGGPMVHIRAVPEGGTPQSRTASAVRYDAGFARTFYARHQSPQSPRLDGRQPLPSRFAARWIDGGTSDFETSLRVWREASIANETRCRDYGDPLAAREIVAFDENENATGTGDTAFAFPATSLTRVNDADIYPQLANGANSGWMMLDLDDGRSDDHATQAWVVAAMKAEGRYATDVDAIAFGNGCSAPAATSAVSIARGAPIAPAPNESNRRGVASTNNDDSCDIALLPAATLLLPYFEVDVEQKSTTTLFTIVNVSQSDQIARVTLWTDYDYPVVTFNVFLTGYDAQSIDLYDVIARGIIGSETGTGSRVTDRGAYSQRNRELELSACRQLPGRIAESYVVRMQRAFTAGNAPDIDCREIGTEHQNAVGYATVDLVKNCSTNNPHASEYWTEDLGYENVLIGDYQQIDSANDAAHGSPMVHIRAIPEGGSHDGALARTFYTRYQSAATPLLDARQPLPSAFAVRWTDAAFWYLPKLDTTLKIWREGTTGRRAQCRTLDDENAPVVAEIVRFDGAENAFVEHRDFFPPWNHITLPATSRIAATDRFVFPEHYNGAVDGWMYINLDDDPDTPWIGSNWIVVSIRGEGGNSYDVDAPALGNGCSPGAPVSFRHGGIIGPRPNRNPK